MCLLVYRRSREKVQATHDPFSIIHRNGIYASKSISRPPPTLMRADKPTLFGPNNSAFGRELVQTIGE